MESNQREREENAEILIDTFPEIPNSIKTVKDGVELTFGEMPEEETVLAFETVTPPEKILKEQNKKVKFELVENKKEEEFAIPDKYGQKANIKPTENNEVPSFDNPIRHTYVPRFTDASERFRLGLYRPEADRAKSEEKLEEIPAVVDGIDPTAEIEESISAPETVVATSGSQIEEPEKNTAKMFKFKPKQEPAEAPEEPAPQEEPAFIEEEAEQATEAAELQEESAATVEEEDDFRDEPFEPTVKTIEYEEKEQKYEEAPWDIGDKIEDSDKREYTALSQRESFIDKILDSIMGVKIRFFTSAALAIILLIAENLFLFGVDIPTIIGMQSQRGAMAILDLIFVTCLYMLALPEVIRSFKCLIAKKATPELYLSVLLIINTAYAVLCAFYAGPKYPLFGVLFAVLSVMAIGASYFTKSAEHSAFTLVSQNGEKRVMDIKYTRELERENIALDGIVKEHVSKTVRFFRTTFISGFFGRSSKTSENPKNVVLTLCVALGVGVVGGVIAYFFPGGIISAISTFALVFSLAVPTFSVLSHKLPYLAVTEELKKENTAIIGEEAVLNYAGADVIAFDDTEVFGQEDVNLQRIMLYGKNENLSKALKEMSALFQKVGGPLDVLFSGSLDRKCPPAYNTFVEEDGVSGEIDFCPVCAGTLDYMIRHRIEIPEEEMKQNAKNSATTRVIYAAENGEVFAKFFIRYSFSEEFSMILPALMEEQITPLIYTRDPNINSEFIKTLTAGNDKIRVIKKRISPTDDSTVYRRINSGGVVLGDKMNAITSLLLAKRYAKMSEKISIAELVCAASGSLLGAVLSLCSLGALPTVIFALIEVACIGGLFWFTKKKIYISPFGTDEN